MQHLKKRFNHTSVTNSSSVSLHGYNRYNQALSKSSSKSITQNEKALIHIGPNSFITVNKYYFLDKKYEICEIEKLKKGIATKTYSINETPLTLINYLTYYFEDEPEKYMHTTNEFWAKEFSNMNSKKFGGWVTVKTGCKGVRQKVFKYNYSKPNAGFRKDVKKFSLPF